MTFRPLFTLCVTAMLVATPAAAEDTLATSQLWFAPVLRAHFPSVIPIHAWNYPVSEIPCLPKDITKFQITAETTMAFGVRAFQLHGTVKLDEVPPPYEVFDGARGRRYMLHLQAYLFSPQGRLVWSQKGFPPGGAWMRGSGDSASFMLINSFQGSTSGHELIVVAAGDPILSDSSETRVILGAKRLLLP